MGDLSEHFSRSEFACKDGCGFDTVDAELLRVAEEVRAYYGAKITVNSGCRCLGHNAAVGGAMPIAGVGGSQHLYGRAMDFTVEGHRPAEVQAYLTTKYPDRFGVGRYNGFTHFDTRSGPPARWSG